MIKTLIITTMMAIGVSNFFIAAPNKTPRCEICGTWILVDRIDRTVNGDIVPEQTLGKDPVGILIYDRAGNVSVQLMKRNRISNAGVIDSLVPGNQNNIVPRNGYVAYFGKYKIDFKNHTVTHMIEGGISPTDIGKSVTRHFEIVGKELRLSFDAQNGGISVRRTLRWRRVA